MYRRGRERLGQARRARANGGRGRGAGPPCSQRLSVPPAVAIGRRTTGATRAGLVMLDARTVGGSTARSDPQAVLARVVVATQPVPDVIFSDGGIAAGSPVHSHDRAGCVQNLLEG